MMDAEQRPRAEAGADPRAGSLQGRASASWRLRGATVFWLSLIVLAYLALATLYSAVTPLGEGPDEPGHAAYVFFLAREGRLPVQCAMPCRPDVPGEGHQPPLAYALAAPALLWLPPEERRFDQPTNRRFVWAGGQEVNAVPHGSREYWPWRGAVLGWHLARLVNVALGAATLLLTYGAGRRLAGRPAGLLAAALVALNPQFLFTSGLLTNDALLVALCAALLWLVADDRRSAIGNGLRNKARRSAHPADTQPFTAGRQLAMRLSLWIGAVLGLALITKQSALLLAPIAGLWCALGAWRQAAYGAAQAGRYRRAAAAGLARAALVFGVAGLISGWWYLRNWQLYGDPLGMAVFQAEFMTQAFEAHKPDAWLAALATLHSSFWARFGWMNVPAPGWAIGIYTLVELLALAGLARGLWRHRATEPQNRGTTELRNQGTESTEQGNKGIREQATPSAHRPSSIVHRPSSMAGARWPLLAFPLLSFAWVVSFALTAGLVAWQGRLLFPALPALAVLLGWGLVALVGASAGGLGPVAGDRRALDDSRPAHAAGHAPRAASYAPAVLAIALGGMALWMPLGVIQPAYPFQTLPAREAVARFGKPVYARFAARADERGAELRSVKVAGEARPGETLSVTLIWHALGRQNRAWQVFIHLVDDQENILAEDNREPRDAQFRMSQWVAGDWVEDPHPLPLPANMPPGTYTLRVGLWYPITGGRAGRFSAGDELLGEYLDVETIVVTR